MDDTCPATPWRDDPWTMGFLYDALAHYRNGYLLTAGGVMDQPAKLMKALAVMGSELVVCEQEQRDTARKRQAHQRDALAMESGGGRG